MTGKDSSSHATRRDVVLGGVMATAAATLPTAFTATPSAPFLSPRPTQRPAAIAAASVTRTSSRARLRSGIAGSTLSESGTWLSDMAVIVTSKPVGRMTP